MSVQTQRLELIQVIESQKQDKSNTLRSAAAFILFFFTPFIGAAMIMIIIRPEWFADFIIPILHFKRNEIVIDFYAKIIQLICIVGLVISGSVMIIKNYRVQVIGHAAMKYSPSMLLLNSRFTLFFSWHFILALCQLLLGLIVMRQIPDVLDINSVSGFLIYALKSISISLLATAAALLALSGRTMIRMLGLSGLSLIYAGTIFILISDHRFISWISHIQTNSTIERSELSILSYYVLALNIIISSLSMLVYWTLSDFTDSGISKKIWAFYLKLLE